MLYRKCPICGSSLDPGETCDCQQPAGSDTVPQSVSVANPNALNKEVLKDA